MDQISGAQKEVAENGEKPSRQETKKSIKLGVQLEVKHVSYILIRIVKHIVV